MNDNALNILQTRPSFIFTKKNLFNEDIIRLICREKMNWSQCHDFLLVLGYLEKYKIGICLHVS